MLDIVKTTINNLPIIQIDNTGQIVINSSDYSNCINEWNDMKMNDGSSYLYLPNLILPVKYNGWMIGWCLERDGNDIHVVMAIVNHDHNKDIPLPFNLTMKLKVIHYHLFVFHYLYIFNYILLFICQIIIGDKTFHSDKLDHSFKRRGFLTWDARDIIYTFPFTSNTNYPPPIIHFELF